MIKYLEKDFEKEVGKKKILVDFYADWCGPCRMMGSILEKTEDIEVLKVNVDNFGDIAQKFGIMSIPTLILFNEGNPVKNHIGLMSEEELREFVK